MNLDNFRFDSKFVFIVIFFLYLKMYIVCYLFIFWQIKFYNFKFVYLCFIGIVFDGLKGRVFEVFLVDFQNDEVFFRKFKLMVEEVQGRNVLINFYGMDLIRDKFCFMVKKWQIMIQVYVDVKIIDGYFFRMFCIGFIKKRVY